MHICRDTQNDSCGFEHVFVGEVDDGHVKGLHNWIQTMVEESRGKLDYMGFVLPRKHNQSRDADAVDGPPRLISVQLGWQV
jgi:poly(U)-specific endoribonuclease